MEIGEYYFILRCSTNEWNIKLLEHSRPSRIYSEYTQFHSPYFANVLNFDYLCPRL
jgi:hypothetical protein